MTRTKQQNKRLYILLTEVNIGGLPIEEVKAELVKSFTAGRTTHSSEMTAKECDNLITHLETITGNKANKATEDKMRKKIFSICHQMAWYLREGHAGPVEVGALVIKNGKPILDYARIDALCIKYGHKHKALNSYAAAELPTLITQFEQVLKSYLHK